MLSLRPRNLNQALGRLLAVVIVPLLLGTFVLLALQARQEQRLAQTRLGALAQALVQASDNEFEHGRGQLDVLAASPLIDERRWDTFHRFAGAVAGKLPGSVITLVGPDGRTVLDTASPSGAEPRNLWEAAEGAEVAWQGRTLARGSGNLSRRAFQTGDVAYSNLYFDPAVGQPVLAVSVPVVRDGRPVYALILAHPPTLLQALLQSSVTVPDMRAILLDRNATVVASNAAASSRLGDKAIEAVAEPGDRSGFYSARARDGVTVVGAFVISARNGFMVRVSQPALATFLPTRVTLVAWLLLLLAAIVASAMLASQFSRRLARPLRELGDDVRAGRPPSPQRDSGIAEIDLLAQALRDGARAERERVEEQTLRTVAQNEQALLQQADRQKDEFLATLAHELRNPLAPIRTAVELIRRRAPADPVVERARATIERQSLHLSRLVDDLLDVSRITFGRVQLRHETLDLGEVAAAAADSIAAAAAQGQLEVTRQLDRPAPFVQGDVTRLTQCVVNVLNNAVKFSPAGGQVRVRVAQEGATAVLEVQDDGVGIAAGNLERIFELFVQERHSGHHGNTGLGIGLALTRRLVELHGGTIRASSEGPGMGATFRIELPAVQAPVPAAPTAPPAPASAPVAGAHVLVVDDNRDAAATLGELLAMSGYATTLAHDGTEALQAVARHPPDAVLLDIGLPDMDGYEVCRRIRLDAGLARQPLVVAVTGWGQRSDQDAAGAAGFDAHMTKPVASDALMELLAERLVHGWAAGGNARAPRGL